MKLAAFLFLFSTAAFGASQSYNCTAVQSNAVGELTLNSYELKINKNSADVVFQTNKAPLEFKNASVDLEHDGPDDILSVQHDAFSMIISLNDEPKQAVINPFSWQEKDYGPFAFLCK